MEARETEHLTPAMAAEHLGRLEADERAEVFRELTEEQAGATFSLLDRAYQQELMDRLPPERALHLIESLDPDDRVQLLQELPAPTTRKMLLKLSPYERRMTEQLLGYPEESAGRVMTPEFLCLNPGMTVSSALAKIRRKGKDAETVYVLPLVDDELYLKGVVHLKDLVLATGNELVDDLADRTIRPLGAMEDREVAARLIQATDTLAAPVVDKDGRLLGLITVDDAMDILDREEGEDLARTGGSEPLGRPYFSVSIIRLAEARIVWLLVLTMAAVLTVKVLNIFQGTLEEVVSLALFIPLLINAGGNTGTQSSTTLVRAMSIGEVRPRDILRVIAREGAVGLLMGAMLSLVGLVPVWLFAGREIALVILLTLTIICGLASVAGAAVPIIAETAGVDPAIASAPFITTLIDVIGLVIYFLIARALLF